MRACQQAFNWDTSPGWFLLIVFVGGMIVYGPAMEQIEQREQEQLRLRASDTLQRNDCILAERIKARSEKQKAQARQSRVWELETDTLAGNAAGDRVALAGVAGSP